MNHTLSNSDASSPGAPESIAALYDRTFTRVYNAIRYRIEDPAAAEELTADVYERLLLSWDRYRPEQGPVEAWLFGIVHHVVGDYLRRRRLIAWVSLEALRDHSTPEPQPEEISIQRSFEDQLLRALPKLKDRERELLGLKYAAGLTNRQIAALVGLTEQNVGVILHRTVERLRGWMDGFQAEDVSPFAEKEVEHG